MVEFWYKVLNSDNEVEGYFNSLDNALVFVQGLFEKYYLEPHLEFTIRRYENGAIEE